MAKTSAEIARKLAERPYRLDRVTAALALLVLFGSICLAAGFKLARAGRPFWVEEDGKHRVISMVLSAPAGWMAFALLLPSAVKALRTGLETAMNGEDTREVVIGWALVIFSVMTAGVLAAMVIRVV